MKVLVSPLDWGLGHATRCIPVIKAYLAHGAEVELATCGFSAILYQTEFPDLEFLQLMLTYVLLSFLRSNN